MEWTLKQVYRKRGFAAVDRGDWVIVAVYVAAGLAGAFAMAFYGGFRGEATRALLGMLLGYLAFAGILLRCSFWRWLHRQLRDGEAGDGKPVA